MKVFKHVTSFVFDKANYELADADGNKLVMKIDYKNNEYDIETNGLVDGKKARLRREVEEIARDLLKRKSGVNFAEKFPE